MSSEEDFLCSMLNQLSATMVYLQMCKILLYFCAVIYWLHNCTIDINYQCKLGVSLRTLHIVLCPKNRSDFLTYCQYRIYLNNAQKYRIVFCIFWPPPIYIHSVPSPTPHISHAFSSSTFRIFRSRNHLIYVIDQDQTVIQRSSPLH